MMFNDELPPENSRKRKWFWRTFKVLLVFSALFFVGIAILTRIGGNDENLRKGLESMMTRTADGNPASVGTLHGVAFFPFIRVYAEDVTIMPHAAAQQTAAGDEKGEGAQAPSPLVTIDTLMFSRSFWDSFFSRNRIEGIMVQGINVAPGFIFPRGISGGQIALGADIFKGEPGLSLTGKYGDHDFDVRLRMDHALKAQRPVYSVMDEAPFTMTLGPLTVAGRLSRKPGGGGKAAMIDSMDIKGAPAMPLKGMVSLIRDGEAHRYGVSLETARSLITADYSDGPASSLSLTAEKIDISDIDPVLSFASRVIDIYEDDAPGIDLGGPMTFSGKLVNINDGDLPLGHITFAGAVDDRGLLKTTALTGRISKGSLSGALTVATSDGTAKADMDLRLAGFDYTDLQSGAEGLAGTADARVKLAASGKSFSALRADLDGEIVVLGGKGRMKGQTINLWGSGLVNTMLPDFNPQESMTVNCVMIRLDVRNGVGTAAPFLIDTHGVTVAGEGTVDLRSNTLDMLFTPEAKGIAVGSVATAVQVEGPWRNPSVSVDGFSLGRTIGKLLLGTINPALWALSLTDIGLGDQHPCRAYIGDAKAP
jgi:hypothetical protein